MAERARTPGEKAAPEKGPPPRAPTPAARFPGGPTTARLEGEANAVALRVALGHPPGAAPPSAAALAEQARREAKDAPAAPSAGDGGMRERMGRALGRDFSGVRLHTGADAAARTKAAGAHAAAQGGDVWFGPGRYRPDRPLGRALIAHELVHAAQQGAAPLRPGREEEDGLPGVTRAPAGTLSLSSCWGSEPELDPAPLENAPEEGGKAAGAGEGVAPAAQPAVPPAGFPADFAENYATIEAAVQDVNTRLQPTTPLDPDWVRAMMAVETRPGTDARQYDPMQVANKGDPALPVMKAGGEHTDLVNPQIAGLLAGKTQTPRKNDRWDYASVPEAERMDAATSVIAGVTWLASKASQASQKKVTEGEVRDYVVQPGDSFARIAGKEKSTTAHLQSLNPGVDPAKLKPNQVIKVQNARMEWYISSWLSWEDAAVAYNGGGDPDYLKKLKAQYALIKAARTPPPADPAKPK